MELFLKVGRLELFTKIRGIQRTQIITELLLWSAVWGNYLPAIINNRFSLLADEINLISECQTGFRKGYSTIDNIFSIHALTSLYFSLGKKLFCSFKDFRKAFDTVRRKGLWQKLQKFGIHGKCFDIIKNMYKNIKSCVRSQKRFSDCFPCLTAVRQGEKPFTYLVFTISE